MGVGGYIALALVLVEVMLIAFLVTQKTNVRLFLAASITVFVFTGFFWIDNRVIKITIHRIGTIQAAADLANRYVQEIRNIKEDVERQRQVVNVVATEAQATDQVINELTKKNIEAADQLQSIKKQLEQAQNLNHKLQQEQEYIFLAKYNVLGLFGLAMPPLVEHSALNNIIGAYIHHEPNGEFHWDCTPEALKAYTESIKAESNFPFAYYYRGSCARKDNTGDWQNDMATARAILNITTHIPGHNANHDAVLKWIDTGNMGRPYVVPPRDKTVIP